MIENRVHASPYTEQRVRALKKKLALFGGPKGMPIDAEIQAEQDPDIPYIIEHGKLYKTVARKYLGKDTQCHWNVAKLYKMGYIDSICAGFSQNDEGWHQHTWGLLGNKVVETTPSNFDNSAWFGAVLSDGQAQAFVKKCAKNKPGQGLIRTYRGGPIFFME